MQLIRCTQKLLARIQFESEGDITATPSSCWHANLVRVDYHDCVLITHNYTLFSLFVPGVSNADLKYFPDLFGQALFKAMRHSEFTQPQIEHMLEQGRELRFAKTDSRSVLGSMNDMKQMLDYTVYQHGKLAHVGMGDIYRILNHTPFKAIGYSYPEDKFREMLGGVHA